MGKSSRAKAHAITQDVVIVLNAGGLSEGASPAPLDVVTIARNARKMHSHRNSLLQLAWEYDIRPTNEDLYLAVLACRLAQDRRA